MKTVFLLLLAFQAKHFLADYPLQRRWMLGKFREDWGFFWPLAAHAGVHGAMTTGICLAMTTPGRALFFGYFDFAIHFTMDRIKASPRYLGRYKPLTADTAPTATSAQWRSNDFFWWAFGLDQAVHHLTHYAVIWALVR